MHLWCYAMLNTPSWLCSFHKHNKSFLQVGVYATALLLFADHNPYKVELCVSTRKKCLLKDR